jgi:hypothetical protein
MNQEIAIANHESSFQLTYSVIVHDLGRCLSHGCSHDERLRRALPFWKKQSLI